MTLFTLSRVPTGGPYELVRVFVAATGPDHRGALAGELHLRQGEADALEAALRAVELVPAGGAS